MTQHRDVTSGMLDDYVRNRLSHEDRRRVEAAVHSDSGLARDLAFVQALAKAVKDEAGPAVDPAFGWARLSRSIAQAGAGRRTDAEPAPSSQSRWWRYAAVLLGVLCVGQATALFTGGARTTGSAPFEFASGDAETLERFVLTIAFEPEATEGAIRMALQKVNGSIVAGPSANALYRVTFETETARERALADLQAADGVVRYVGKP